MLKKNIKVLLNSRGLFLVLTILFFNTNYCFSDSNRPAKVLSKMFNSISKQFAHNKYKTKKMLNVSGSLSINTPVSTLSKKLKNINESASFSFGFDGSFLPNGEKKLNLSGDLGSIIISDYNNKSIIFSEDFSAYSLSNNGSKNNINNFKSFFISKINRIKEDILNSGRWSLSMTNNVVLGSENCYKVTASTYIKEEHRRLARSKSQNFNDLISFWKRGKVIFFIRKKDNMPEKIEYENPIENIKSELFFSYNKNSLPVSINVHGNSAGIFGSGELQISYNSNGIVSAFSLDFSNQLNQTISLSSNFIFDNLLDKNVVRFLPPIGSQKMGKENLKLLILTNVAGTLLRMQQAGIKIKTLKF